MSWSGIHIKTTSGLLFVPHIHSHMSDCHYVGKETMVLTRNSLHRFPNSTTSQHCSGYHSGSNRKPHRLVSHWALPHCWHCPHSMQNRKHPCRPSPIWRPSTHSCRCAQFSCSWPWWNIVWWTSYWVTQHYRSPRRCRRLRLNRSRSTIRIRG